MERIGRCQLRKYAQDCVRYWTTIILACTPESQDSEVLDLREYLGPIVPGINQQDAQRYCNAHGLGYCKVSGEHVADVDFRNGNIIPAPSMN